MHDMWDGEPLDLDFSGAASMGQLPTGRYLARVEDVAVRPSRASGQPTLYITFEITGPPEYATRRITHTRSLSDQPVARGFLQQDLIALGFSKEQVTGRLQLHPRGLVDRQCVLRVTLGEYEGEPQSRVSRLLPVTTAMAAVQAPVATPFEDLAPAASPGAVDDTEDLLGI